MDWRDRRLIGNLCVRIRVNEEHFEPGKIGRGVRQGCPLPPLLFNVFIEEFVREAVRDLNNGIMEFIPLSWSEEEGSGYEFVCGLTMMTRSQEGLQTMMDKLNTISTEVGIKISIEKTRVSNIMQRKGNCSQNTPLKKKQKHAGSRITTDVICHGKIKRRIAIGKDANSKRNELLREMLNRNLKKRMAIHC